MKFKSQIINIVTMGVARNKHSIHEIGNVIRLDEDIKIIDSQF